MTWRERNDDYLGAIGFFVCIVSAFLTGFLLREFFRLIF